MTHLTIIDGNQDNLALYNQVLGNEYDLKLIQQPDEFTNTIHNTSTNMILMDINLPNINGLDLYEKIKKKKPDLPVIFLTNDPNESKLVNALELGAQDYIVKPVSLNELLARVRNKLKLGQINKFSKPNRICFKNFILHCDMQCAEIAQKKIQLTPIEFKLIHHFSENPNKIFSKEYITNYLWPNIHVQNQNIDTHLSNLRKKIMPFSKYLKTIRSRGYILRI